MKRDFTSQQLTLLSAQVLTTSYTQQAHDGMLMCQIATKEGKHYRGYADISLSFSASSHDTRRNAYHQALTALAESEESPLEPLTEATPVPKNKVTLEGIRDKIKHASYILLSDKRTTICQLTLENGFTIIGTSACVDAANYDEALGNKIAYENAEEQIWKLEGYLLAEKLHLDAVVMGRSFNK